MPLTLATFNVKDLFLPDTDEERLVFVAKTANVAAQLLRANADVVGLQEVGDKDALRAVTERVNDRLGYGEPIVGRSDARGIANALLARVPVLSTEVHTAGNLELPVFQRGDPSPFGARIPLRRGIVRAVVDGGATAAGGLGPVHVLVCHLKSKLPSFLRSETGALVVPTTARGRAEGELRSLLFRSAEALFLRGLVDDILAGEPTAHVAVLGDFNDTLDSAAVRLVTAAGHRQGDRLPGTLFGCASDIPAERRFTVLHGGARDQIDHILVTEGLRARLREARILNEELRDHGAFVETAPPEPDSDHALFVATFA